MKPIVLNYSRDSFDRFGDDLSELIMGYIGLEDAIRLQCVSKQFNDLVFNRKTNLDIGKYKLHVSSKTDLQYSRLSLIVKYSRVRTLIISYRRLEALFGKCHNIKTIIINGVEITAKGLDVIADCCPRLQSLTLLTNGLNAKDITRFGEKCGSRLRYLKMDLNCRIDNRRRDKILTLGKELLPFCLNLKTLEFERYMNYFSEKWLPKLESIASKVILRGNESNHKFCKFVDKYQNQLKQLKIDANCYRQGLIELPCQLFDQIIRLRNVQVLDINYRVDNRYHVSISEKQIQVILYTKLSKIGINCPKIKKFSFNANIVSFHQIVTINLAKMFNTFRSLVDIKLKLRYCKFVASLGGSLVSPLNQLKRLDIQCKQLDDNFFCDVAKLAPNLESLTLNWYYIKATKLLLLPEWPNLTTMQLYQTYSNGKSFCNYDNVLCHILDCCPRLTRLHYKSRHSYITIKTLNKLISVAKSRPKVTIEFVCECEMRNVGHISDNLVIMSSK